MCFLCDREGIPHQERKVQTAFKRAKWVPPPRRESINMIFNFCADSATHYDGEERFKLMQTAMAALTGLGVKWTEIATAMQESPYADLDRLQWEELEMFKENMQKWMPEEA